MKTLLKFVILLILLSIYSCINQKKCNVDHFSERLQPMNRILDLTDKNWAVWCCSPIYGPDQKVHVFFARSPETMANWSTNGEIAHAVADRPEGPYTVLGTVLKSRGKGYWDAAGLIGPRIYKVDGKYALFFTGAEQPPQGKVDAMHNDKIGLLISADLYNWSLANSGDPVLVPSDDPNGWDRFVTNNAAFLKHPVTGEYWLYYRGARPREEGLHDCIGLAVSKSLEGPYIRIKENPVINTVNMINIKGEPFRGFEDPCVWYEDGKFRMLVHDLGYNREMNGGYYFESADGIHWGNPEVGYYGAQHYWEEEGRVETPLLLLSDAGKPDYLFVNRFTGPGNDRTGWRYSGFVFKIKK